MWSSDCGMQVMQFCLKSPLKPQGDQPKAIKILGDGIKQGLKHQVLLGVTGSGKTFTLANVIEKIQKPTLVIAPNKTLAAQLYHEFKYFFPEIVPSIPRPRRTLKFFAVL